MKRSFFILLFCAFYTLGIGQSIDKKTHRKNIRAAEELFDKKDYKNAATAFQKIIETSPYDLPPEQMLNTIIAFANLNKETIARDYLNLLSTNATKDIIDDVKSLDIFKKYYSKKWWKGLEDNLQKRIEALIKHHQTLTIFDYNKTITYSAIRISPKGDTLANTKIILQPDGTGWGSPTASLQSQAIYTYQSSLQDSIDHIQEVRDIVHEKFWNNIDTTGVIENDKQVWMHPFRNNEFFKTEIAPFPMVVFPINYENTLKVRPKTIIMRGWGTYSPSMTEEKYFYVGTKNKNYSFGQNILCHQFNAYGHNSVHGVSYLEYYFHEKYGFTEMNYLTYDNDVIQFKIIDIQQKR